jgi:RNA polymerase sigma-70 factor (ECF subfamily)
VLSDEELVVRVLHGDVESFGLLSQRYERTVLAVAWAELRDLHAAEDVAQTTLVLAFERLVTLRNRSSFGPWLMQIARRQVTDAARQRKTAITVGEPGIIESGASDSRTSAWIDEEHLCGLIRRLPDQERVLIGLRYFDGHTVVEIAEITVRSVGTVTKQLSRAICRLRAFFQQEERT